MLVHRVKLSSIYFNSSGFPKIKTINLWLRIPPYRKHPASYPESADLPEVVRRTVTEGRGYGNWEYDSGNHMVTIVLPIRIGVVDGGNHSISAGILSDFGYIDAVQAIDLRRLYPHVYCDGCYYRHTNSNKRIAPVKDEVFGAVFEIGRIIASKDSGELAT